MLGPQKQTVPVLLTGLDQKQSKQVSVTGNLDVLQNMVVQKTTGQGYEFVPRPGSQALSRTADVGSITSGFRLGTLGQVLALFDGNALWRKATDKWHFVEATAPAIGVQTDPIVANSLAASSVDAVYVNGYRITATVVVAPGATQALVITCQDANGSVTASTTIATAVVISAPRIVVSGTYAVIFWTAATNTLYAAQINTASPSTIFGPSTLVTTAVVGVEAVKAQAVGASGNIVVAYLSSASSTWHLVLITASSMAVGTDVNTTIGDRRAGLLANDWSSNVIYLATCGTGSSLAVSTFNGTTLATIALLTVYDAATPACLNITGTRVGASVTVVLTTTDNGTTSPTHAQPYDVRLVVSTGGAVTTVKRSLMLQSEALVANGTIYVAAVYLGAGQGSVYLVDVGAKKVVGRALQDVAATSGIGIDGITITPALGTKGQLSSLSIGPTANSWLTSALKNIAVESAAGIITYYTGSVAITWTYLDATLGRPVELNGLHIPGSNPYFYDGQSLVEDGFPIAPELSDAITTATGGGSLTPGAVYTWRCVYAWPDALGNIHRSPPTIIAQSQTLGPADNQATLSIPTLRVTRKQNVTIEVYRDQANGDGSTYNMVSNPSNPILNDPTVDRVSFTDQVSDAAQAGGLPLYTDGLVLDNLPPAPCKSFAVHRGRILVGGVDGDPQAVWFSKDVSPGFGVAFSDGLVSRLNATTEAVTSVGSMDAYAVAYTPTTTWASGNEYPDDTGAGGVLQFQQYSSQTGVTGPLLSARNDQGFIVVDGTKGIWRLSRGVSYDDVGSAVDDLAQQIGITAAFAVPSMSQSRIIGGTTVLVYESVFGTWARWNYGLAPAAIIDGTVWNGTAVYLCADGTVIQENTAVIDDNATPASVAHQISLSNLNMAGVAGFWRLYGSQYTGRALGSAGFTLNFAQSFDGSSIPNKTLAYNGTETQLNAEVDPGQSGKCSGADLTVFDSGNGANSAFTLAAVTLLLGTKDGLAKLPPARRAT